MNRLDRLLLALAAAGCLLAPLPGVAAGVGDAAPGFALPDAAGARVSLEALRGQVVYVDFWASWCGPCRRSFPWMNELQRKYGGKGLAVVAVNVDKRREDAQKFLRELPPSFTVVYDAAGNVPAAFDVKAMPTSYLIDADGRVVAVEQGFRDERASEIESRIRALLASRRT